MKDDRLYMRFPNTFADDLGDLDYDAIGAFVAMVGEARKADNDGVFHRRRFEERWPAKLIKAILAHGPSPILVLDGDVYRMPQYGRFQQTRADREQLSQRRADAGRNGNAKRWTTDRKGVANAIANGSPAIAESESESERHDRTTSLNVLAEVDARDGQDEESIQSRAAALGVGDLGRLRKAIERHIGNDALLDRPSESELLDVVVKLSVIATGHVRSWTSYIEKSQSSAGIRDCWALVRAERPPAVIELGGAA